MVSLVPYRNEKGRFIALLINEHKVTYLSFIYRLYFIRIFNLLNNANLILIQFTLILIRSVQFYSIISHPLDPQRHCVDATIY